MSGPTLECATTCLCATCPISAEALFCWHIGCSFAHRLRNRYQSQNNHHCWAGSCCAKWPLLPPLRYLGGEGSRVISTQVSTSQPKPSISRQKWHPNSFRDHEHDQQAHNIDSTQHWCMNKGDSCFRPFVRPRIHAGAKLH